MHSGARHASGRIATSQHFIITSSGAASVLGSRTKPGNIHYMCILGTCVLNHTLVRGRNKELRDWSSTNLGCRPPLTHAPRAPPFYGQRAACHLQQRFS
eukprot:1156973-Pelagomonas_calceolata.AAC.1